MPIQLKPSEFVVSPENPFANDKLDRKKCAETLTNLVQNAPGPLVISINGGWGTGKTVFLRMWKQHLQNSGFTTIYFNAWQDDYCHDPLIALIGQIWTELKNSDFKEIAKSVKECAASVFRTTIFNAVRATTAGIVDLKEEQLKSISEKAVDEYVTAGEKLKDLKERLGKLAQEVQKNGKPLIIIIDELDRCRPTFAIELLEKVKHLFDTTGILFVLGIDREQLGHSIKCVYGHEMDVNGYLRRFIDLEFILPEVKPEIFTSHLFDQFGLRERFKEDPHVVGNVIINGLNELEIIFPKLCACFQLSLRDIEHCCQLFAIVYTNISPKDFLFPKLLATLVILKLINDELYRYYVAGRYNCEKVIKFILDQPTGKDFLRTKEGQHVDAYLFAASPENWRQIAYNQMELMLRKQQLVQPEFLPDRIKTMEYDEFVELYRYYAHAIINEKVSDRTLGYLSKKIELASLMLDYRE